MRRRKRMLEELDQDIRDHIERETQDNIERGTFWQRSSAKKENSKSS
jgi:hypothetical protein